MARYINIDTIQNGDLFIPATTSNADYRKLIASGVTIEPWVEPTAAELLAAERAVMNPFYTAFRFAMKQTPTAGHAHLLARVTQTVAAARAQDPFSELVIWADSVTQIVRTHPDMTAFAALFSLTPEALDDLCRLALQIEAGP